ncbi:glycosyltransferase family 2 protein [Burkholderia gladioli]|uniref:glycosyltransferase family 2 protein n=1 Tax=Burkholderia gladioli TaxID=28095 RepID=UPI001640716F|nr:glycosyltransferase family 2 protein [Burkholderia gladioli]
MLATWIHKFSINMKVPFLSVIRRTIRLKVSPARDLALFGAGSVDWVSTGENPVFALEPADGSEVIPSGWVYIESRMIRRGANLVARLHVDLGTGFSDVNSFVIPATRSGNIRYIIKIPRATRHLQLSPMRSEGLIGLEFLKVTKISSIERVARMVGWVIGDLVKFKNTDRAKKYNITWLRLVTDLTGVYADCGKLRFHSAPLDYKSYVERFDILHQDDIDAIRWHVGLLAKRPLISVLILANEVPLEYLRSTVQSVLMQIYENWEMCIVSGAVDTPEISSYLECVAKSDDRIKIIFSRAGAPASDTRKDFLAWMSGEFVTILSRGVTISPHAFYLVAVKGSEMDGLNVIYADHDEIDENGDRDNACFNGAWNPDLFFSCDMISRAVAYRASILREIGEFSIESDEGGCCSISLGVIKNSTSHQICHIPRVLYHFHRFAVSGRSSSNSKNDVDEVRVKALSEFFKDQPGVIVSQGALVGTCRVQYPIPMPTPRVTLIIPTRDGGPLLKKCIASIFDKTVYDNIEILIVNNQSVGRETIDFLRSISKINGVAVLNYDFPFNYSSINNFAERYATGDVLCFLNDDVEAIESDWLREMVSHALRPDVGAVGAKLLYADGFIQHAGVVIGIGGFASHVHRLFPSTHPGYAGRAAVVQNFSAITGACLVMRRNVFRAVGGFDEENLPVAFNDVDLCLRLREAGYRIVWTPYAVLYHYESYSRGDDQASSEKRARFNREKNFMISRWGTDQFDDPYYSVNLTLDREDFSISNFPRMYRPWRI